MLIESLAKRLGLDDVVGEDEALTECDAGQEGQKGFELKLVLLT